MSTLTERTPQLIAAEINSIKDQTRTLVLLNSIEIGRRLIEAKAIIFHGDWLDWLKTNVDYSKSTANNLMRICNEYGSETNIQALGNLNYTQAVALLGMPESEKEQFVNDHDLEDMTTRELQQAIKERDELKQKLDTAQEAANQISFEQNELREKNIRLEAEKKAEQDAAAELKRGFSNDRKRFKENEESLKAELEEAKAAGASDERVQELERDLKAAQDQVDNLTKELNTVPAQLEPAVIEKVPESVEQELAELREKAKHVDDKQQSEATLKFRVFFEALTGGFKNLLAAIDEMGKTNPDEQAKYKIVTGKLLDQMRERI